MSLEQALADNTAAINALIGVWSQLNATANAKAAAATAPAAEVKADKPKADKPKAEPKAEVAADPKPAAEPSAPEAPAAQTASSSEASPSVDYPVLQKAVFALAGKSRDAAAAVAAGFGVKTFKELPADQWGDALAAVNAKLAELEAA
jgi:hypothetical protein